MAGLPTQVSVLSQTKNMAKEHGICHVPSPGEPDRVFWFGFDCAHAWDMSPGNTKYHLTHIRDEVYRDLPYVKQQCQRLAGQLKELENSNERV